MPEPCGQRRLATGGHISTTLAGTKFSIKKGHSLSEGDRVCQRSRYQLAFPTVDMPHVQRLRKLNRNRCKTKRKDLTSAEVWQLESLSARLSEDGLKKDLGRRAPFEAGRPRDSLWSHHRGQDEVAPVVSSTLHSQVANHHSCNNRLEEGRSCMQPSVCQRETVEFSLAEDFQ